MARPPSGQIVERDGKQGRTFALGFRAYGKREYVTTTATNRAEAEEQLAYILAQVKRGTWRPPAAPETPKQEPTFHEFGVRGWPRGSSRDSRRGRSPTSSGHSSCTCSRTSRATGSLRSRLSSSTATRSRRSANAKRSRRREPKPRQRASVAASEVCRTARSTTRFPTSRRCSRRPSSTACSRRTRRAGSGGG